jgi:hypothetical protein
LSANLHDYSDRGIILAIEDCVDGDGYASILDISAALGMENARGLGTRLAWMRKFKMVERHKDATPTRWKVPGRAETAIANMTDTLTAIEAARTGTEFDLVRRHVEHYRPLKVRRR